MANFLRWFPLTFLGPAAIYLTLYWWFVPTSMRLSIPLAEANLLVKIVAIPISVVLFFISRALAEALYKTITQPLVDRLYRLMSPTSVVVDFLSLLLTAYLFSPLVGFPTPKPTIVACVFLFLILSAWLKTTKKSLGIYARVEDVTREISALGLLESAEAVLARDPRPLILYLRSFSEERRKATTLGRFSYVRRQPFGFYVITHRPESLPSLPAFLHRSLHRDFRRKLLGTSRSVHDEQLFFAEYFETIGPYIAIGRPGEATESMDLGASRLYVKDELWQEKVSDFLERAAVVVLEAAHSAGLAWEFEKTLKMVEPERVLLILPRSSEAYREFCLFADRIFPYPMPTEISPTRLLMFDHDWSPIPLTNYTMILEDALEPFASRLGLAEPLD